VTVAEEQRREVDDDIPLDMGFTSANSAAAEAMVEHAAKIERENAEKKIHPMFRRDSRDSSRSRSASVVEEKTPVVRAQNGKRRARMGKVQEEAIEIDISDEEDGPTSAVVKVGQAEDTEKNRYENRLNARSC